MLVHVLDWAFGVGVELPPGQVALPITWLGTVVESGEISIQRVLVVEDDPVVARTIERAVRAAGFYVKVALNCSEARAAQGPFIVGVFDLELPDGSGFDLAQELLKQDMVDRAVFFTACTDGSVLERVSWLGPVIGKREGINALTRMLLGLEASTG